MLWVGLVLLCKNAPTVLMAHFSSDAWHLRDGNDRIYLFSCGYVVLAVIAKRNRNPGRVNMSKPKACDHAA